MRARTTHDRFSRPYAYSHLVVPFSSFHPLDELRSDCLVFFTSVPHRAFRGPVTDNRFSSFLSLFITSRRYPLLGVGIVAGPFFWATSVASVLVLAPRWTPSVDKTEVGILPVGWKYCSGYHPVGLVSRISFLHTYVGPVGRIKGDRL